MLPLAGVVLTIRNGPNVGRSTVSDSAGRFALSDLVPGTFTVRMTKDGYQAQDETVSLTQDETIRVIIVRNCEPWPSEIVALMARLPLPDRLCLVRMPSNQPSNYVPSQRVVYYRSPAPIRIGNGEIYSMAHEICHARQHRVLLDAGFPDPAHDGEFIPNWIATAEGRSFLEITGWRFLGGSPTNHDSWTRGCESAWEDCEAFQNPLEDNAEVCTTYYDPARSWPPPNDLFGLAPLRAQWAERWLPRR